MPRTRSSISSIADLPETIAANKLTDEEQTNKDIQHDSELIVHDSRLSALEADKWKSIRGSFYVKPNGGSAPTLLSFNGGNLKKYFYNTGNVFSEEFILDDTFENNKDIFLRLSYGHNGTTLSGNLVLQISLAMTTAIGTIQPEKVFNVTIPCDIINIPKNTNVKTDIQLTSIAPSNIQFNSDMVIPGVQVITSVKVITKPTTDGNGIYFNNSLIRQLS